MEEVKQLKEQLQKKNVKIWDLKEDYKELKTKLERLEAKEEIRTETIKKLHNYGYDIKGNIHFDADNSNRCHTIHYTISQDDALGIACTLLDSLGLSYSILTPVEEAMNNDQD